MKSKDLSDLLIGQDKQARNGRRGESLPEEKMIKSASLLDDTLTDTRRNTSWKTPIWISVLVIAGGILIAYFSGGDPSNNAALSTQVEASRNPELLEKLVDEAKEIESEAGKTKEPVAAPAKTRPVSASPVPPPPPVSKADTQAPIIPKSVAAATTKAPVTTPKAEPRHASAEESPRPENMPQLIRDIRKEEPAEAAAPPQEDKPIQAANQEDSFIYLQKNSQVAEKLISGGYSNLVYSGWKVIRETDQEIWIDVEAVWTTGGPSIHHIWSVDVKNGKIKALSQAARNLEALQG